jgi:hypothetical protein
MLTPVELAGLATVQRFEWDDRDGLKSVRMRPGKSSPSYDGHSLVGNQESRFR